MTKSALFTVKLEPSLRDQFMAEAEAADRPASQIIRDFMRDFVKRQQEARDHDAWFRSAVAQGLADADDPATVPIPHDDVMVERRQWRAALAKRAGERPT